LFANGRPAFLARPLERPALPIILFLGVSRSPGSRDANAHANAHRLGIASAGALRRRAMHA
jgi:hypothetical protein